MARSKTVIPQPDAEEGDVVEQYYDAESLNPALEQLYVELGITGEADTTVHVSKVDADGRGNDANIWKGDPDQYDLETLAKKFGSGQYRVMVYVKLTTGQKVRKVNKTIAWLLSPDDEAKRVAALTAPQPLAAMQPQQPQVDFAAMLREMGAMFQNTILQLQQAKPAEVNPLSTLQGIKELAAVITPAQQMPREDSFEKTMRGVELFMGLQNKLTPEKLTTEDGDLSMPAVIMAAVREFKSMRGAAPGAAPNAPAPANVPALTDEQAAQQQEFDEMNIVLRYQLKQANKAAAAGEDAAEYANSIYSVIPDDVLQMIATDANWFAELCKVAPECAAHTPWYMQIAEQIKRNMVEDGLLTVAPVASNNSANGDHLTPDVPA